jgi:hypothetical protein
MTNARVSIRTCLLSYDGLGKKVTYRDLLYAAKKIDASNTPFIEYIPTGSLPICIELSNRYYEFRFYVTAGSHDNMYCVYKGYWLNSKFFMRHSLCNATAKKPSNSFQNNILAIVRAAKACTEMDMVSISSHHNWDCVFERLLERSARIRKKDTRGVQGALNINAR